MRFFRSLRAGGAVLLHPVLPLQHRPACPLSQESPRVLPPGKAAPRFCPAADFPPSPLPPMQRVAGAKAIPDARRADGAPQQARTSPGPQGREGSRRRPARHTAGGVQSNSRDNFRVTAKGEYGGAGGESFLWKRKLSDGCGSRHPRPSTRKNRAFSAVRGQRYIRSRGGSSPLTPCPAPGRRPAARSGQQPQFREAPQ